MKVSKTYMFFVLVSQLTALETIDEIGRECKEEFFEHGGNSFEFIPCLNSDESFISALMEIQKKQI